jgi:hypothetical protein
MDQAHNWCLQFPLQFVEFGACVEIVDIGFLTLVDENFLLLVVENTVFFELLCTG